MRAIQTMPRAIQYGRRARNIALIVASASALAAQAPQAGTPADAPPPQLLKKIALREEQTARLRDNYTYRQSVTIEEFDGIGAVVGVYHEVRDITFSPKGERYEEVVEKPRSTLHRLILTEEDFADIRNVQPFLLTPEQLISYEYKFQGEEMMNGERCFIVFIRPRQLLSGQRLFEGTLWVRVQDLSVVRSEGQAVPQIMTTKQENLFPHFTTIRRPVDGEWFFPVETFGDDTLFFRTGPQRVRIRIRYTDYKKFGSDSTVKFGESDK
jgi:hypothetical protein